MAQWSQHGPRRQYRSLIQNVREEHAQRQQAQTVKAESKAIWSSVRGVTGLPPDVPPQQVAPTGFAYTVARQANPALRPASFARTGGWQAGVNVAQEQQQRREETQRQLAEAFQPQTGMAAQQYAFQGIDPVQAGQMEAAQFGQAVQGMTPEQQQYLPDISQFMDTGVPSYGLAQQVGEQGIQNQLGQDIFDAYRQQAMERQATAPALGPITVGGNVLAQQSGRIPYVGEETQRITQPMIGSDLGLALTALGIGAGGLGPMAEGTLGAIGGGQIARDFGAPPWMQAGAELAGGFGAPLRPHVMPEVSPRVEIPIPEPVPPRPPLMEPPAATAVDVGHPPSPAAEGALPPAPAAAEAQPAGSVLPEAEPAGTSVTLGREMNVPTVEREGNKFVVTEQTPTSKIVWRYEREADAAQKAQDIADRTRMEPPVPEALGRGEGAGAPPATAEQAQLARMRAVNARNRVAPITPEEIAELGASRQPPTPEQVADARALGFAPDTPRAAGAPPAAGMADELPDTTGGAPLTPDDLAARRLKDTTREAFTLPANPGREAREVWRKFYGAKNEGTLQTAAWLDDVHQQARRSGIRVGGRGSESPQQVEIMERIFYGGKERGPIGGFKPQEQSAVQAVYDRYDRNTARLLEADPDFSEKALPDYASHMFTYGKPTGEGGRGFSTRPGFLRHRELEGPLGEILKNRPGLDLKTWDFMDMAAMHEGAVNNYIASLEAIRALRAKGLITDAATAPATWRVPKDVAPFKVMQQLQDQVAEPKVARELERMFGESAFDTHGFLKAVKNVRETAFMVKVFGGLFQGIDYTARAAGLGMSELGRGHPVNAVREWGSPFLAVARTASPALDRRLTRLAAQNPEMRALYREGLGARVDPSFSDEAIHGLGKMIPQTVAGHQIPGAAPLAKVIDFMSGGAYKKFHTQMLETAGMVNLQKELRGGRPLEEAARRAAEETNVYFSSIPNWQSAAKSATSRDIWKSVTFAFGELEAWPRMPLQSPAGLAGLLGTTVIAAEMLNKLFTGHYMTEEQLNPLDREGLQAVRDKPSSLLNFDSTGLYNTRFLRPELPWKGPDGRTLYLDLLGQADTPFRWALDPVFATQTRLGQLPRTALDVQSVVRGEAPAFGEKVEKTPESIGKFVAQEVSPIAVTGLTGTERGRIGLAGAGIQTSGLNVSAQSLAERKAEVIKQHLDAGDIGPYDKDGKPFTPTRVGGDEGLTKTDALWLKEHESDLFNMDDLKQFSETLGEGDRKKAQGETIGLAGERLNTALDQVRQWASSKKFGSPTELDSRQSLMGQVESALDARRAVIQQAVDQYGDLDPDKGISPTQRAMKEANAVYDRHPTLTTPEEWDAFDADWARTISASEQTLIDKETSAGDHPTEIARRHLTRQPFSASAGGGSLSEYYDQPAENPPRPKNAKGRAPPNPREAYRRSHAGVDAALWAMGKVTDVMVPGHRSYAIQYYYDLYGVRLRDVDVGLPEPPRPSRR